MTPNTEELQKIYETMVIVCNRVNTRPEDLNWGNRTLCENCMIEYAAAKDKEIAELKGDVLYWKGIAEMPEIGKKTIEQFLERELAAAKDRIAELEKEVERLKDEYEGAMFVASKYQNILSENNLL